MGRRVTLLGAGPRKTARGGATPPRPLSWPPCRRRLRLVALMCVGPCRSRERAARCWYLGHVARPAGSGGRMGWPFPKSEACRETTALRAPAAEQRRCGALHRRLLCGGTRGVCRPSCLDLLRPLRPRSGGWMPPTRPPGASVGMSGARTRERSACGVLSIGCASRRRRRRSPPRFGQLGQLSRWEKRGAQAK